LSLNKQLLLAHVAGDKLALSQLYAQAADQQNTLDATCFFLTQAYVFALDAGSDQAKDLHRRLKDYGREE
jgi:hypothetical protein